MVGTNPPSIPTDDRGLLLGDGLFETVRLYCGRPFRLERHLARLERGASTVGIEVPADLRTRVADAVESFGEEEGALRITLTRGPGDGLSPPAEPRSRLILGLRRLRPAAEGFDDGLRALVRGRVDERSLVATLKTIGYLERIQALRVARLEGADEALLSNSAGRIVEGSASNLFAMYESSLFAPGPDEGALPGITREALLEIAATMGLAVVERGLAPRELRAADEVMLSSSLRGVVPVVEIEGMRVALGRPGPTWRAFVEGFSKKVANELGL